MTDMASGCQIIDLKPTFCQILSITDRWVIVMHNSRANKPHSPTLKLS